MAGYVYGGTEFDAALGRGRRPRTDPLNPSLCGTTPGVSQHRRLKQPCCLKCAEWYNSQRRARRHEKEGKS